MKTVWVENPQDGGSAVWGCEVCWNGAWCFDHTDAHREATLHAQTHRIRVRDLEWKHGPAANAERDTQILTLREQGQSIRAIALEVGLSNAGVTKALRRKRQHA